MLECVPTVDILNLGIFVGIHDEALEKLSSLADVRRHVAEALVPCLKNRGTFMSENTLCFVQLAGEWATSSKQQECCVSVEAMIRTTARTIVPTVLPMSFQPFIKALAVGKLEYTLLQECHPNSPSMLKTQDVATTFGTVLQAIAAMKKTLCKFIGTSCLEQLPGRRRSHCCRHTTGHLPAQDDDCRCGRI